MPTHTIPGPNDTPIPVTIRPDKRLTKTIRWQPQPDGSLLLRVPAKYPKRKYKTLLADLALQYAEQELTRKKRKGRTDADLQKRAKRINKTCFNNELDWQSIRWVSNMNTRLGSCTNGGVTDGHIRISDKIRDWPEWVVDAVIAHELAHRKHSDHSKAFWAYLKKGYPLTEKARGFIEGVGFAKGTMYTDD